MAFTYTIVSEFLTKEECNMILDFSLKELKLEPSEIISDYTDVSNVNTNIRILTCLLILNFNLLSMK